MSSLTNSPASGPSGDPPSRPPPASLPHGATPVQVRAWRDGHYQARRDAVADEVPVALSYNGTPHAVMMATPTELEDFGYGFSVTEDIVSSAGEIQSLQVRRVDPRGDEGGFEISMRIAESLHALLAQRQRNLHGRTGCGLCGAETIEAAIRAPKRVPMGVTIGAGAIRRALEAVRAQQALTDITGAVHAAAWCTPDGLVVGVREDVGRHNALDKLIGHGLRNQRSFARGFVVITSRASYEMVQKAACVGMPILVAISAPTAYAVRLAEDAGITLIGFARGDRHVIYTHPGRVQGATADSEQG